MDFKIKDEKTLIDGFFQIKEVVLNYDHFDQSRSNDVTRLSINKGHAAACMVYLIDINKYVLIEQFRYPVSEANGSYSWVLEVVAGKVDENESPQAAAIREVEEETDYVVESLNGIAEFFTTPGICSEKIYLFLATATSTKQKPVGDPHDDEEDIEVHLFSREELSQLIKSGRLNDAKTLVAVYHVLNQ